MKKEAKESKEAKETKKSGNKKNDIVDAALPDSDASVEDKTLDNDGKVGTMLRETRLKRGEELVDIARKLCIRRVHLQAIEDSNYAEIPEAPYGQGFVRSYADYLGLNSIRMAQLFKEETEANSHKGDLHMLEPQAEASVPNYKYIIMSMVAIAAIYVGWVYYNAPLAEEQQLLEESLTTEVDTPEEDYPLQVEEFEDSYIRRYFEICRRLVKEIDPNLLYLGCSFSMSGKEWENACRISSEYCDVVSCNTYRFGVAGFSLPKGAIDKPVLIGEWHFAPQDGGNFGVTMIPSRTRQRQCEMAESFLMSAINNPNIAGADWFEWTDIATTGRFDKADSGVGFLDIADTPHYPLIETFRRISSEMYALRLNSNGEGKKDFSDDRNW